MDSLNVWAVIIIGSTVLSVVSRIAAHKEKSEAFWFFEIWRDFVCFSLTGAMGYFFVVFRWPSIVESGSLSTADFILGLVFVMGALGTWPYFIKNVTQGIEAIISRFLSK